MTFCVKSPCTCNQRLVTKLSCLQRYLADAERDKERYQKELEAYHQTEAYKTFVKKQQDKKRKGEICRKQIKAMENKLLSSG